MNSREVARRIQNCVYGYADKLSWTDENGLESRLKLTVSFDLAKHRSASEGFILTLSDGQKFTVRIDRLPDPVENNHVANIDPLYWWR